MNKIIVSLILGLFVVSFSSYSSEYTRSQCITKTVLFWDNSLTKKERLKVNNDFFTSKHLMWLNKERLKLPIPSIRFSSSENHEPKFMYSQYTHDCKNKEKMLLVFLEHIKFYVPNFPKYKITQEIVKPSIKTIEVNGEWWVDGCKWQYGECVPKI